MYTYTNVVVVTDDFIFIHPPTTAAEITDDAWTARFDDTLPILLSSWTMCVCSWIIHELAGLVQDRQNVSFIVAAEMIHK